MSRTASKGKEKEKEALLLESDPYWKQFYKVFYYKYIRDELSQRSSAVAFSFTLSVFPIIIFLFSLIPYVPIPKLNEQIMNYLREALPRGIYNDSKTTIQGIIDYPHAGLLSFGFLLTLYASTSGMVELMTAFEKCNDEPLNRSFVKQRMLATGLVLVLGIGLLLSTGAIVIGEIIITNFAYLINLNDSYLYYPLQAIRFGGSFLILTVSIMVIYGTSQNRLHYKYHYRGALLSVIGIILLTKVFSYYLANFASYNKVYGSIGTFIAFMVWINLVATILLIGYEVNATVSFLRIYKKSKGKTASQAIPTKK